MNFATIGASIWGVLKKTPDWLIWLAVGLLFWKWTDWSAERRGQDNAKVDEQKRDGEEQARINEARAEQAQENTDAAQRADDTADSVPWVRARDELWDKSPGDAAILLDPVKPSGS